MRGRAFAFVVHSLGQINCIHPPLGTIRGAPNKAHAYVRMLIMAISNRGRRTWLLFTVATIASAAAAGSPTSVPTAECVSDLGRCGAGSDSGSTACCESDQSVRLLILT